MTAMFCTEPSSGTGNRVPSAARALTHEFAFSEIDTITQSQRDRGELSKSSLSCSNSNSP